MWLEMCQSHWPAWSMNLFLFQRTTRLPRPSAAFFFWGYIVAIDCTRAHIQAPRENEGEFINRNGRHSINVQIVCDADLIITNCVVRWPGSVHDARILRASALYRDLQTNRPDGIILGDSAYPLLPWLMTPFLTANTLAQARFNTAHCRARFAIERLSGDLKRRFACLNYLRAEPQKACDITLACLSCTTSLLSAMSLSVLSRMHLSPLETLTNLLHTARTSKQDVQQGTQ